MGAKDGFLVRSEEILHDPIVRSRADPQFHPEGEHTLRCHLHRCPVGRRPVRLQSAESWAAVLGLPYSSMVIGIDAVEKDHMIVRRELEGGLQERIKISVPCVLSIQSGINEPRYVSIMGIRKASQGRAQGLQGRGLCGSRRSRDRGREMDLPARRRAVRRCSTGELDDVCSQLLGILKEKGVFQ